MILRFVTPQDCPALLDIYAQYIDTGVTFEYDLPTREEFTAWSARRGTGYWATPMPTGCGSGRPTSGTRS